MMDKVELEECKVNTATLLATYKRLGVPIAPDKPSNEADLFGNRSQMRLCLPEEKLKGVPGNSDGMAGAQCRETNWNH